MIDREQFFGKARTVGSALRTYSKPIIMAVTGLAFLVYGAVDTEIQRQQAGKEAEGLFPGPTAAVVASAQLRFDAAMQEITDSIRRADWDSIDLVLKDASLSETVRILNTNRGVESRRLSYWGKMQDGEQSEVFGWRVNRHDLNTDAFIIGTALALASFMAYPSKRSNIAAFSGTLALHKDVVDVLTAYRRESQQQGGSKETSDQSS